MFAERHVLGTYSPRLELSRDGARGGTGARNAALPTIAPPAADGYAVKDVNLPTDEVERSR